VHPNARHAPVAPVGGSPIATNFDLAPLASGKVYVSRKAKRNKGYLNQGEDTFTTFFNDLL
jgi:hypothetical protein